MSTKMENQSGELEALFDETASTPDEHQLTRMAARAQDIPTSAGSWWGRWWVPATLIACAAVLMVGLLPMKTHQAPPAAVVVTGAEVGEENPAPLESTPQTTETESDLDLAYEVVFDVGWGSDDDTDDLLAGPPNGDLADDDLFAAYDELLTQDG